MDEAAVKWGSPWGALMPASSEAANLSQPTDLVGAWAAHSLCIFLHHVQGPAVFLGNGTAGPVIIRS